MLPSHNSVTPANVAKERPIAVAMAALDKSIANAYELTKDLSSRLNIVKASSPSKAESEKSLRIESEGSELAASLLSLNERIKAIGWEINDCLERLQL